MKKKFINLPLLVSRTLMTLTVCTLLSILAVVVVMIMSEMKVQQPLAIKQAEFLTIKPGTSFNAFSKQLVNKGWLQERFWLRSYVKFNPQDSKIKSGTYQVQANMSTAVLLNLVVSGKEHQFSITFIEGSTFKQVLAQLAQHPHITHQLANLPLATIAKKLSIEQDNPEGWLFPETYAFTQNTTDLSIIKRAYEKMQSVLEVQWHNRAENLPYKSRYQALIMASIIEKESGRHTEHPRISSVFVNRLNKKMRLQTDPTVIYGLGERYQGDITYAHLREKTAYNTYKIKGLPPTPIALPGAQALRAALQPELSEYLYFVSNGEGEHIFSKNLADHNRAVTKYQRKKN
ncbi:endolytic transglycosylase MltG [Colwellia sp. C1TZA3]|uniref:endolytic transglycosylase MltG n=1 Tax=Colwellia sp. C1TZA3 TaxID=2508879 RepID=UPI0011B9EC11|nr:endolytic transglycosylase MltG [Colwellia sp. C1TZA3]TWX73955.1 endolytic transglycosylase MltG [Colwellia sp. C1TZA3]